MTEIKKTLAILKARWPEVILLIGLNALVLPYNKLLIQVQPKLASVKPLVDIIYFLAFIAFIVMLKTAFLRTVYLDGNKRQSPLVLLLIGKYFLGRLIKFGLLYIPVYWILAWLIFLLIRWFTSIDTGFSEAVKVAPLVYQLCFVLAALILIKPLLLIFPLIVVLDCRISKSFKLLKQCKLLHARELIILFLISMAGTFLWVFLPSIKSATTISQYILIVAWSAIQHFISLMVAVMAVRFVASQNLVYDEQISPSDSQRFTEE